MVPDLAERAEPVGNLFNIPHSTEQWDAYRLTEDQIQSYRDHGYVSGVRILNDEQVEILRAELTSLYSTEHPGHHLFYEYHRNESTDPAQVLFHALGGWRITPGFHDVLWNPAFTLPASQLLDGAVRFWHDQLFCKPAHHGGVVAWHQDYSYWTRTIPMAHLTCWIGLDDADESNGCLQYIAGSHKWDLLPATGLAGDMAAIRQVLTDDQWERLQNPTPMILRQGEAAFHHPLMVHGSQANHSDRPRRAFVLNVFRDGTRSNSDEPLLTGTSSIPKGTPMGGPFHPLLLDPERL